MAKTKGRVTIPTDMDVVPQTLEIMEEWGADAIRDCDGTEFPQELKDTGAKIYATYYTTRKDNDWAKANPDEVQQMYIMTPFYTAVDTVLEIHLMNHLYPDMLKVNNRDDITRWWEVMDRTTGEAVSTEEWSYDEKSGNVDYRSGICDCQSAGIYSPHTFYGLCMESWNWCRSCYLCVYFICGSTVFGCESELCLPCDFCNLFRDSWICS